MLQKIKGRLIWIIIGVIAVILAGWLFIGWWSRGVVSIKTAQVIVGSIEEVVSASGVVDAPVYDLGPKLGGKIITLQVKEGDRVFGGETLAEFDDTTRLVAPAGGIVAKVNYDVGETVIAGTPAIIIVNYAKSWINAQIDEIDIANIKIGNKVKITTDVYPDKIFEGRLYWVAPLAELRKVGGRVKMDEESYVFPCKIRFSSKHDELKVNMSVNAEIITRKKEMVLLVPREALVSKDDQSTAFIIKKNRAFQVPITLGIRSYTRVEVLSGLASNEVVAITNGSKLKDRGRVKIEH
ncbi:MAG: efflux RND transporter periplasmic adaptor subunit [Candidatus Margulisbacteria bacterium]|nr:efflux RND transporter periplasmic adaptor subunit [Candidatus Margulisiibacteriota bacterium]